MTLQKPPGQKLSEQAPFPANPLAQLPLLAHWPTCPFSPGGEVFFPMSRHWSLIPIPYSEREPLEASVRGQSPPSLPCVARAGGAWVNSGCGEFDWVIDLPIAAAPRLLTLTSGALDRPGLISALPPQSQLGVLLCF